MIRTASRVAFVGGVVAVTVGSLSPSVDLATVNVWDKAAHFAAYGALGVTGIVGFTGRHAAWLLVIGLVALGCLLEVGQYFIGRYSSVGDIAANTLGALAGILATQVTVARCARWGRTDAKPTGPTSRDNATDRS